MIEAVVRVLLVVAVVGGGLWAWRHAARQGLTARGGPVLRVVGRAGLTRTSLVAVVDVDGQRYLVGAAEHGVSLLAPLGDAPPGGADHLEDDGATPADATTDAAREVAAPSEPLDLVTLPGPGRPAPRPTTVTATLGAAFGAHGRGTATTTTTSGPRIGPLDRLRDMTVRSHLREPIRAATSESD